MARLTVRRAHMQLQCTSQHSFLPVWTDAQLCDKPANSVFLVNQLRGAAPCMQPPGVNTRGKMVLCLENSRMGSSTSEWLCIAGARTTIANAAYSFLHPWTQKGNMAVRLKKLHESAQARYEKSRDGLVTSVAQQQPVLTGQLSSTSSSMSHM